MIAKFPGVGVHTIFFFIFVQSTSMNCMYTTCTLGGSVFSQITNESIYLKKNLMVEYKGVKLLY
jgi:hypothetical protein